uniref:TIL domain-containing protein n=1 Tax=Anopheles merus TaxID=30066 RepID=A0A1I8JVD1_ANOME
MTLERFTALALILATVGFSALPCLLGEVLQHTHLVVALTDKCTIHGKQIFSPCIGNETYVCCGFVCEKTCDNPVPICPMRVTCPWRCFCHEGLVRHEKSCILPSECPTPSPSLP